MDFKKAFTYMFLDKELPKVFGIGSLIFLLMYMIRVFVNPYSYGYLCLFILLLLIFNIGFYTLLVKNMSLNIEKVLPDWIRNFKHIVIKGILFTIAFVLPIILFKLVFKIILLCFSLDRYDFAVLLYMFAGLRLLFKVPLLCYLFFVNAMFITFVHTGSVFSFFKFKTIWKILKLDFSSYLIILVLFILMSAGMWLLALFFTLPINSSAIHIKAIVSLLIFAPASFYIGLVNSHLLGQYYKKYLATLEQQSIIGE